MENPVPADHAASLDEEGLMSAVGYTEIYSSTRRFLRGLGSSLTGL